MDRTRITYRQGVPSQEEQILVRVRGALCLAPAERIASVTRISRDMLTLYYRGQPPEFERALITFPGKHE